MEKLNEQLENIKARANRQSKSSRDKLNILANERQRSTVGDYKLETIHEIHDEIADVDRLSNFISNEADDPLLYHQDFKYYKRENNEANSEKKIGHISSPKFHELSIISQKNQTKEDRFMKDSENISINAIFRAVSEQGHFEKNKIADDTLHCS